MGFEGIEEGKKTKMVTPFSLGTWLVHSLAHELAASPEATRGGLGKADDYMRGKLS